MEISINSGLATVIASLISAGAATLSFVIGMHNKSSIQSLKVEVDGRLQQLLDGRYDAGRIAERQDRRDRDILTPRPNPAPNPDPDPAPKPTQLKRKWWFF